MSKVRVPISGTIGKSVFIDTEATKGAQLGVNLLDADGSLLTIADIAQQVTIVNAAVPPSGSPTSHLLLADIGSNSHAAIDSHIADSTIHFTEASIDHNNIQNVGVNSHAVIDIALAATTAHIADTDIHFSDAPADGTQYARKDNAWEVVAGGPADGTTNDAVLRWDTTAVGWVEETDVKIDTAGVLTATKINVGGGTLGINYFGVYTPGNPNGMLLINNSRMMIDTTAATAVLNIGGDRIVAFQGGGGSVYNCSQVRSTSSGSGSFTINSNNIRATSDVGGGRFNIKGTTDALPALAIQEGQALQKLIKFEDISGAEGIGFFWNGFTTEGTASGISYIDVLHNVGATSADGDGVGISLSTENASGTDRNLAYIDTYYADISADDAVLRLRVRPGSSDQNPTTMMQLHGKTQEILVINGVDFIFSNATGTKFGTAANQKISFWGKNPSVVQPTAAIAAAAFVANTSGIADDTATYGGYTGGQIVAALQKIGILA